MPIDQRIRMYEEKFARVSFPLRASHYDTKLVLDLLLHKNHFLDICKLAFGPLNTSGGASSGPSSPTTQTGQSTLDGGIYWMDHANYAPESKQAQTIFAFLAPGGALHTILEQLSVPTSTFHSSLKKQWKDQVLGANDGKKQQNGNDGLDFDTSRRFDFPLSCLSGFSRQIVAESRDTDLTSLGRHRVPPIMLVPFWQPPVVTREEATTRQPQNSLPCTALGYFLLRLMHFVFHRCANDGRSILADPSVASAQWKRTLDNWTSWLLADPSEKASREFPVTLKLLLAYHDYYLRHSPAHVSKLLVCRSLEDAGWDVGGVVLQMLFHGPASMWLRRAPTVRNEAQRQPITDNGTLACLTVWIEYLSAIAGNIHTSAQQNPSVHQAVSTFLPNIVTSPTTPGGLGGASDSSTAAYDIQRSYQTIYRYSLEAIRYATMSYSRVARHRSIHYENLFALWLSTLRPMVSGTPQGGGATAVDSMGPSPWVMRGAMVAASSSASREGAIWQRYEALTYAFGDVVGLVANSACVDAMSEASASHFLEALNVFCDESVSRVLVETSKHLRLAAESSSRGQNGGGAGGVQSNAVVEMLRSQFVLNWERSDGVALVPDIRGPEIRMQVARAIMAIWRRAEPSFQVHSSSLGGKMMAPKVASLLLRCADTLQMIVPEAKQEVEKLRQEYLMDASRFDHHHHHSTSDDTSNQQQHIPAAYSKQRHDTGVSTSKSEASTGMLSLEERQRFMDGRIASCRTADFTARLTFPTHHRTYHNPQQARKDPILRSDEFPPLVSLSMFVDDAAELVQTILNWKRVPRCHNGHPMWLVDDIGRRCSQHHDQEALWECHTCQVSFCVSHCRQIVPVDPANKLSVLRPITPADAQRYSCSQCRAVFPSFTHIRGYTNEQASPASSGESASSIAPISEAMSLYCGQCASRPFQSLTTRRIAAYSTIWLIVVACGIAWWIWRLLLSRE